jgi:hypothetical protein
MPKTDLCVLYAQDSWGQCQSDEGGREQHLQTRDIAFLGLGLLVKRIGGVYSVAFGGACARDGQRVQTDRGRELPYQHRDGCGPG